MSSLIGGSWAPKESYLYTHVQDRTLCTCLNFSELTINGMSCLESLEYHSSRKLVCLRPNAPGVGEVIVTTFNGGSGTCTVQVTIQQPEVKQLLGKYYLIYTYVVCTSKMLGSRLMTLYCLIKCQYSIF